MLDKVLREELVFQLLKGNAHMSFEEAIANFPEEKMNEIFPGGEYTFWHLLEHIRRTQHDILGFILNPTYKELEWPKDYWPARNERATQKDWDKTIEGYINDRSKLKEIAEDNTIDIIKNIPWGNGQTIMREIYVVTDHTAYHLGEFAIIRQVLNAWGENHQ